MIKVNDIDWNNVILSILPLLGVVVGGLTTYFAQSKIEDKKITREREKEEERKEIEKLEVYSQILMKHGEMLVYTYIDHGYTEFDSKVYKEHFRPIIFLKIYLLDNDIIDIVRTIDRKLMNIENREEVYGQPITISEGTELSDLFYDLIKRIDTELKEY